MVIKTTDLTKPRSISMADSDWSLIREAARKNGVSVSEFVRVAARDALNGHTSHVAPLAEPAAVRIPPVPSVRTLPSRQMTDYGFVQHCKTCGWILVANACKNKCAQPARAAR